MRLKVWLREPDRAASTWKMIGSRVTTFLKSCLVGESATLTPACTILILTLDALKIWSQLLVASQSLVWSNDSAAVSGKASYWFTARHFN